jgi:hypothetical protein
MMRPRISLVWCVSARAASIFAWLVCARDKLYDVFFWRVCEVVDPCVPSIGRAGQARKNWALPQFAGARISGAADRVLSLSFGAIKRRWRNLKPGAFRTEFAQDRMSQ